MARPRKRDGALRDIGGRIPVLDVDSRRHVGPRPRGPACSPVTCLESVPCSLVGVRVNHPILARRASSTPGVELPPFVFRPRSGASRGGAS